MPTLILAMAYMSMVKFPQVKSTPYPFLSNSPNSKIDISKFHPGLLKKWLGLIRSPLNIKWQLSLGCNIVIAYLWKSTVDKHLMIKSSLLQFIFMPRSEHLKGCGGADPHISPTSASFASFGHFST